MKRTLFYLAVGLIFFGSCKKSDIRDLAVLETQSNAIHNEQILSAKDWVKKELPNLFFQKEFSIEKLNWQESRVVILDTTGAIPPLIKVPFRGQTVTSNDVVGINPEGLRYIVLQKLDTNSYDHFFADFHYSAADQRDIQDLKDDDITTFTGFMVIRDKGAGILYAEKYLEGKVIGKKTH